MTALWIILGIFAFLFLLLLCPVTLTASYETQLKARLHFLFFSYRLAPPKEKKTKKKKKVKKVPEGPAVPQKSKLKQLIEERGFMGFLRLMKELTQLFVGLLGVHPVVGGACILFFAGADEGTAL